MKSIKESAEEYAAIASGVIDGNTKAAYLAGAKVVVDEMKKYHSAKFREAEEQWKDAKRVSSDEAGGLSNLADAHLAAENFAIDLIPE